MILCRYVLSFALGAGPVPALLLPEIFASRIRAKAVALSLGMHWVSHNCSYTLIPNVYSCPKSQPITFCFIHCGNLALFFSFHYIICDT